VSCARAVHRTVKGRYKTTHKKVVSNFSKERMLQIDFLNFTGELSLAVRPPYVLIFPSDYIWVLTKSL
jgi:hypothetical protein